MSKGLEVIALSTNKILPFVMFKTEVGGTYRVTVIPPHPGDKKTTVGVEYLTADLHGDQKWVEVSSNEVATLRSAVIVLFSEMGKLKNNDGGAE